MHDYAEMGEYRDADIQDKYTYYNGELSYPVGLMTADEVAFAGVVYGEENTDAYYNLNALDENIVGSYNWWTMTPVSYARVADVFIVKPSGRIDYQNVTASLKSCVLVEDGNGTSDNPYTITIDNSCASKNN